MERNNKLLTKVVRFSIILFIFGYSVQTSFADEGDSPLEAYSLPYNTGLSGTIGSDSHSDYYKIIVPATGRLVISLYDIHLNDAHEQLSIYLLKTTQNSIGTGYSTYINYVAQSTNDYTVPEIIDIPDLARGIYFIEVKPNGYGSQWDGGDYMIKAEFTVFPPVVSDDIGDKKQYAIPVVNQLPIICSLSGNNDIDYFECHVPNNTNLTLSITGISGAGNVDMEVFTALDVLVESATDAGNTDEVLFLPDLVPGQYFIKISGQGSPQYTFTAIQEFSKATDILDDVGDDITHAMPLLAGNPSVFCLQSDIPDNDIFSVYQPEDGPFTVDVYNMFVWDVHEDLYIQVLDEYGQGIAQSDNGSLIPEHIEINLPRGQYFVAVYPQGYGSSFNGVIYTINVETSGYDVGDAFNQAMQIHAIPYGSETYGYPYIGMIDYPGDADFFQVVLKDRGFIYLELDRMLYSNVDIQLFDAYHNVLQSQIHTGTDPEIVYEDDLDAGVYFIKVFSPDDGIGQYRLTPTIGTPISPISDDIGDDISRSLPLIPYRRVNGYIWDDGTNDYFSFTLENANNSVRVHVNNQHVWDIHEDIRLFVYDSSGTQIGFSDNDIFEDEIVELDNLGPGVYYIKIDPQVYGSAMNPVEYNIVVETDAAPLPCADLYIPDDIYGNPGGIVFVPVFINNTGPDEISSMSVGVQFDSDILEPIGICNEGLTLRQWNTNIQYTRSTNSISVSMNNFSTVQSGELLNLVFWVKPDISTGSISLLNILTPMLNGALVPSRNGSVVINN